MKRSDNVFHIILFRAEGVRRNRLKGGFCNDVWYSEFGSEKQSTWTRDSRYKVENGIYSHKIVRSGMTWHQVTPGREAPTVWPSGPLLGQPLSYYDWISCQDYFKEKYENEKCKREEDPVCQYYCSQSAAQFKEYNMWSPRRGHAAAVANNALYVIGGRARESSSFNDAGLIGGVIGPRIETSKYQSTIREQIILKNDIWVSLDGSGKDWMLVTPGCKDQQEDIMVRTELWSRNKPNAQKIVGSQEGTCEFSSDCYGDAKCRRIGGSSNKVCVCSMFAMREHHTVSIQNRHFRREDNSTFSEDYIIVVGGFTNVRRTFCNGKSCGSRGTYRLAMDDAWISNDGKSWVQIKPSLPTQNFLGRGGHSSILIHANPFEKDKFHDKLWIFGGQTINTRTSKDEYLNDVWSVDLLTEPCCFFNDDCDLHSHPLKEGDIGTCVSNFSQWFQVVRNASWSGRSGHSLIHEPPSATNRFRNRVYLFGGKNDLGPLSDLWTWYPSDIGTEWMLDFASSQQYQLGTPGIPHLQQEKSKRLGLEEKTPTHSPYQFYFDLNSKLSYLKSVHLPLTSKMMDDSFHVPATDSLLSNNDVIIFRKLGIISIADLAGASLRTILKLRGYDYPWMDKSIVSNVCYVKLLVDSFVEKCKVVKGAIPNENAPPIPESLTKEMRFAERWNGCSPLQGYTSINVHGLGQIPVPQSAEDIQYDLQEMHCRQTPQKRFMASGAFVDGKVLVLGGTGENSYLYKDTWSRDESFPQSSMAVRPKSYSSRSIFMFESNEDGVFQFEYKIFDAKERLDVTPWLVTTLSEGVDISWLDSKLGGPGSGLYTLYVRAIDPGGNKDFVFSTSRNCYTWFYLQPLPWRVISGAICAGIIIVLAAYLEYRRRERKAALERYAERRKRRKFKLHAMTDGGTKDWKEYYHNGAGLGVSKRDERNMRRGVDVAKKEDEENILLPPIRLPSSHTSRPKGGGYDRKKRHLSTSTSGTKPSKESRARQRRNRRRRNQMIKPTDLQDSSSDEDEPRIIHRKRAKRKSATRTSDAKKKHKTRSRRAADVKDKFR